MILVTDYCATNSICVNLHRLGKETYRIHHTQENPFAYIDFIDQVEGLVLSGGEDIHPRYYNEENKYSWPGDGKRDDFEIQVLNDIVNSGKKVLGICRGHQLMNVAFGGTLYQDIHKEGFSHSGKHLLELSDFGIELFGEKFIDTNSLHHQAVKDLADTFDFIAEHHDGTIEGIYSEEYKCLGVQWHPEMMIGTEEVFQWLIN